MCAIAGFLQIERQDSMDVLLEKMLNIQNSRGPDGQGKYYAENLIMGHKRLKIFDLSEDASQPMIDKELGLSLVFNGEIYNFKKLRKDLQAKGYTFTSTGDTEVLLKAYDAFGIDCLNLLEGMFAFAIWDDKNKNLILARDRLGIKPLYYSECSLSFTFASTLQSLLQLQWVNKEIDLEALHYYLTFHAIPDPLTLFKGIRKLQPGALLIINENGQKEIKNYWQLNFNPTEKYSYTEQDWIEKLNETLELSIARQLAADVPVGIFLSGGLDSSLLLALAHKISAKPIDTFSIGFESFNNETGDEFFYSDKIAKKFNTNHHKFLVKEDELESSLANCVSSMSEPMVSHDNIAFYILSHQVSKKVKVVLSGQGADEIFAGYHWFQKLPFQSNSNKDSADLILKTVADRSYAEYQDLVTGDHQTSNITREFLINLCERSGTKNPIEQLIFYESTFALSNGPLCRVDNMTMSASLEARVPFLDERMIQLAFSMPLKLKLKDNGKYILKQLGRKMLPLDIVDRPKGYFPVPAIKHLQGNIAKIMEKMLSPETIKNRGFFNPDYIHKIKNKNSHAPTGGSKIWQIALLEYWLQQQNL